MKQLSRRLATVEAKLVKAKRRLVEVDADLLDVVQENIRELRHQQTELNTTLEDARTPQESVAADIDAKVDKAMELYSRLRETLQRAEPADVRELLKQSIEKVTVDAVLTGESRNKLKYKLVGGEIWLVDLLGTSR